MTRSLLARLRAHARSKGLLAAWLAIALGGAALTRLPLFEVPGYELGAALAIAMAVLGGWAGIASARLERAVATGKVSLPTAPSAAAGVALPFAAAASFSLAALVPPLLAAVLGAVLSTRCDPWSSAGFYFFLPVPSALLAAAAGMALGFLTRRGWVAGLCYGLLMLASLGASLWPLWAGPQVFALNHFLGYFPGPLYDEALPVDGRLLWYRLETGLWTVAILAACIALLDLGSGTLLARRPIQGSRARALAIFGLALLAVLGIRLSAFRLGLETTADELENALGGRTQTTHFVLHYPASKPEIDVKRLERDLELKYAQVVSFLGAAPTGLIHAWFHESSESKRQRVGAAGTDYAKPWRLEFHVEDAAFPHPVARHELAHVLASAFGSPLLRVSARWIVGVNIGLVEGLAVAADNRADELTVDQWAAAMRKLKLAPDIRGIVGPAGFYRQPAARAYTLVGSFLRFLTDKYGSARLRALYPHGDFQAAYGEPLETLASQWEQHLDTVPLDERALHAAQVRFEPGSIFERPCAREVAALREQADHLRLADPMKAAGLYRRCSAIEQKNPAYPRYEAEVLRQRRDFAGARALLEKALALSQGSPGARAQVLLELGDLSWEEGQSDAARSSFLEVLALHRDRATDRAAAARLQGLDDPSLGALLRRFFAHSADLPEVVALQAFADGHPDDALTRYLVGRQLVQRGDPFAAIGLLRRARELKLAPSELEMENLRLLEQAGYLAGDCATASEAAQALASDAASLADRAFAEEWTERCTFEAQTFGGLLENPR